MDALSNQLHEVLSKLGNEPNCLSERTEHLIKHILHLLYASDETALMQYYGLFGEQRLHINDIAKNRGVSSDEMLEIINTSLRRLAVTPEWQMLLQTISI